MRLILTSILLLWLAGNVLSQQTIRGTVVNGVTRQPISGVSVFLTNTSKGTTTNSSGYFEITDIKPGKYELVSTSVGFETTVFSFTTEQLPLKLRVEMKEKLVELDNVVLEPFVEESWEKWGKTFLGSFIGNNTNAKDCILKNHKDIRFRYYKRSNRLEAIADKPLVIENKVLGYKIEYQLEAFEMKFREGSTTYYGYTLFTQLGKDDKDPKKRWVKNREKAYYGSMKHFFTALYNDKLLEEGFEVRRMVKHPNLEKQRVRKLGPVGMSGNIFVSTRSNTPATKDSAVQVKPGAVSPDSTEYYRRVLRQNDFIEEYGRDFMTLDSISIGKEGQYKLIYFPNYLSITYKNGMEDQAYLDFFHENRKPYYQRSLIFITEETPLFIAPDGSYFYPDKLLATAWWGFNEKISTMLPQDYEPGEK
ncbi:carboxypeptidase-like regulatory domain-containing protein [Terrimonas rubra]|uniref:Carboxypeptidase-like regulatory domain-containing protein n=1 Tax=Terrimonas rubra TaxID=1035890 RepID=A0ABW6A7C1_9BACT